MKCGDSARRLAAQPTRASVSIPPRGTTASTRLCSLRCSEGGATRRSGGGVRRKCTGRFACTCVQPLRVHSLNRFIRRGGDVWLDDEADWCDWNDVKVAACYARLLRQRGELERLHAETVRVLQLKEVWPFVERLANALDLTGCLNFDDDSEGLLPAPLLDWPPTPRGEEARLRASIRVPLTTGGAA